MFPSNPQFLHMSIIFKNNTDAAMLVTHNYSHVPLCIYTGVSLAPEIDVHVTVHHDKFL
jgi:hypothetical protein